MQRHGADSVICHLRRARAGLRGLWRDILRGFELGADDCVVKPFQPLELAARLKRFI